MLRTLHGKLALALLGLLVVIGGLFVFSTIHTSRRYQQEVRQKVNAELAARLVRESMLMVDASVDERELAEVVHGLAMMNPGVELYVLDPDGKVLKSSVPAGEVGRDRVDLAPIERFLEGDVATLVLGDDPRGADPRGDDPRDDTGSAQRRARPPKPFSAARIPADGPLQGFLYVVLSDPAQDSVAQMVRTSYVLNLSLWTGAIVLALVFVAGYLVFRLLTRRVKRLAAVMTAFRDDGFARPSSAAVGSTGTSTSSGAAYETNVAGARDAAGGHGMAGASHALGSTRRTEAGHGGVDEVTELEQAFGDMAHRIAEQVGALEQSAALRRELLTNVSHDLRTPLAALQGYLETLEMKEESLGPEQRSRYLGAARKHAERLGRLVSELFDLAMLESGEAVVKPEAFPITELVQDVAQKFQLEAERKGVVLGTEFATDLPAVVADIGMIERVLTNLLENALRYTPPGGSVRLILRAGGDGVAVEIADTGRGIAPAELPYIFDRFYRAGGQERGAVTSVGPVDRRQRGYGGESDADRGTSTADGPRSADDGVGLGLAIAKRALELHGRDIEASSVPQGGTTFRFSLPVSTA